MKLRWSVPFLAVSTFAVLTLVPSFPTLDKTRVSAQERYPEIPPAGGGNVDAGPMDSISDEQHREIQQQLAASISKLTHEGRLAPARPEVVLLSWPLQKAASQNDFNIDDTVNFVDQNLAFPDQLRDWNCGARTYDQANGYNHSGTDIATWPFTWKKVDDNGAEIIAAAPGTIIQKSDGNFDRNCSFNTLTPNAVYVRHSDGSVAWYLHMKSGSLTTKQVGDTVAAGEKLGVVGSSGSSTSPHLHFELYNAAGQLQDPYQGTCNTLNSFTYWSSQDTYRKSRINNLMTASAPPVFPSCPTTETTNEKLVFQAGETIYLSIYYRDQQPNQSAQYSLLKPDGSIFQAWSQTLNSGTIDQTYYYYTWILPANTNGTWKFRAVYNSTTYDRTFTVGAAIPFATVSGRALTSTGAGLRNASVSLTSSLGVVRTASTSSFGFFAFDNVPTNDTYTARVASRQFRYAAQTIQLTDNLTLPNFVGLE